EAREEKAPHVAVPAGRERLALVLEAHVGALAVHAERRRALQRDVELEHALERLRTARVARVGGDLAAALDRERTARQVGLARGGPGRAGRARAAGRARPAARTGRRGGAPRPGSPAPGGTPPPRSGGPSPMT